MKHLISGKLKTFTAFLASYWLLVFFISTIAYLELVYRLWNFKTLGGDYIFPVLFAVPAGTVLFLLSGLFSKRANNAAAISFTVLLAFVYSMQLIYYCVFHTPLSAYSLTGAGDVLQFGDIIAGTVMKNFIALVLLFVPLILLFAISRKLSFSRIKTVPICITLLFCITSYAIPVICVNLTDKNSISQYTLYYKTFSPELSVSRLGLMTTMRLDVERLVFGFERNETAVPSFADSTADGSDTDGTVKTDDSVSAPEPDIMETGTSYAYNVMDIDFQSLIVNEKDKNLLAMHEYFSSAKPTRTNDYTGIFEGDNLILITAEAFAPYAISEELTPTLYKMSGEGFVFENFYNPIWGVSTSDGEYVACTGLLPETGIWSFARSGKNYLPFVMGNQFKRLDYITKAYHNHTYTYYKRNISHPNMGYDYKGVGNGLKIEKTWPESDLEMIEATADEFIGKQPFHTYYMTISGHMNYSFTGNYIAKKNKPFVSELPYSDASKAYIACNIELDKAMKALIDKLETSGIAGKTVIAISADHYPYGLPRECIDELAGHKVESNFELYKSTFILWKKGMEPVLIDKPCSSLDIIPTLSNLFGLRYDSRLLMGSDILSDASPLVIFSNRSWITDKARFNAVSNDVSYMDGAQKDADYIKAVNKAVSDKFEFSAKILKTDYYSKVISQDSQR